MDKAFHKLEERLSKLQVSDAMQEIERALNVCRVAVETLRIQRQGGAPGVAGEKLLVEAVPGSSLSALGMRDLRGIGGKLKVRTASWRAGESLRAALCCGASAELSVSDLQKTARLFRFHAKASSLRWAAKALNTSAGDAVGSSASSICICIKERLDDDDVDASHLEDAIGLERAPKRLKGPSGPKAIRVRHLLLRCADAGRCCPDDPMARRSRKQPAESSPRLPAEAEKITVALLEELLTMQGAGSNEKEVSAAFRKLCQQHSECSSADNAGTLCGDLGWISRGQVEAPFEQAAFCLQPYEFSDVVSTSRGVHLIQRLA